MLRHWLTVLLLFCSAALPAQPPQPLALSLTIASLEREGLVAEDIEVQLARQQDGWRIEARVRSLAVPGLDRPLRGLHLACPQSLAGWPLIDCTAASLEVDDSPWGRQRVQLTLGWDGEQALLGFGGLKLAGDSVAGELDWQAGRWKVRADAGSLSLQQLPGLAPLLRDTGLRDVSGRLRVHLEAQGQDNSVSKLSVNGRLRALDYADAEGRQAGEGVALGFSLAGQRRDQDWLGALTLDLLGGELYSEPLFFDFKAQPAQLVLDGLWQPSRQRLALKQLNLAFGPQLRANGNLVLDLDAMHPTQGELRVESDSLGDAYRSLVQPWLIGSPLDRLELSGFAAAHLGWSGGELTRADLALTDLYADDARSGSGVDSLAANLHWRAEDSAPPSSLAFDAARLDRLSFGATRLQLLAAGSHLHLVQPFAVPFYDGRIAVHEFTWVQSPGGPDAGFAMSLDEVSLQRLTAALGWPPMKGTIQADLPRARLQGDSLRVAGDIRVQAFDGLLLLRGLSLERLGDVAPILNVEMELRRLDLSKLTQTFSFGEIQGHLDGSVNGLQLVGWQPNRFDAHLYSSPDDNLRHRISQRAVENLTELGNGVSGALSGTFLSIFEEFSYDRVDLKVSQRGAVAEIGGIAHEGGGYYIVKGSGIPRIDVIGRNRRVGWDDLLRRLQSVRFGGASVR